MKPWEKDWGTETKKSPKKEAKPAAKSGKPWEQNWDGDKTPEAPEAPEQSLGDTALEYGGHALDAGGRALDFLGGLSRTSIAQMGDTFTDENSVTSEDFIKALKGQAPSSEEYARRFGIEEGDSVTVPLLGDISERDVGGFVADTASDPLTYMSLGAVPAIKGLKHIYKLARMGKRGKLDRLASRGSKWAKAAKAGKVASAVSRPTAGLTSGAGEAMYKSGFKNIDQKLLEQGKKPLSDIMLKEGVTGNTKKIQQKSQEVADRLSLERQGIYDRVNKTGKQVDMDRAFDKVIDQNEVLRNIPGQEKIADAFDENIYGYLRRSEVPIDQASASKSIIYESLPAKAFDQTGKKTTMGAKFNKDMGKALKEAIEKTAKEAGEGTRVSKLNEDLGTLLSSRAPVANQVSKANNLNYVTSVDAGAVAINPLIALAKKAGDMAKTTYFRTKAGKKLKQLGDSGTGDILLRRLLLDNQEPNRPVNPWR